MLGCFNLCNMNSLENLIKNSFAIEQAIGYQFKDRELMVLPFIHRSYVNENRDITEHNERLEFFGDSVLGFLISEYLYATYPEMSEGDLSSWRSRLVEASSCTAYVNKLHIEEYILLGKGEKMNDGRGRISILADFFEALVGAIYLDGGLEATRTFLFTTFSNEINEIINTPLKNWKALLQDYCQKTFHMAPLYHVLEASGPDHSKVFKISVSVQNQLLGQGEGLSKKEAQQDAAREALSKLQLIT